MKRVKFVSGFNAKMALVACAVAGFTLTSCEKEDFNVEVPNISVTVPEINWPEAENDGLVYLTLTATSNVGEDLSDAVFTMDGAEVATYNVNVSASQGKEVVIAASCTGYYSNSITVQIPDIPADQILTIPVNVVLEKVELDGDDNPTPPEVNTPVEDSENVTTKPQTVPAPAGGFQPGKEYEVTVTVPSAIPYMTTEQKTAMYAAVDALNGPVSRVVEEGDLDRAKENLRAQIDEYRSTATMGGQVTATFTVTEAASSVTVNVNTTTQNYVITFSVTIHDEVYEVSGECTVPVASTVTAKGEGVDISHSHDHGNNPDAGGGTGE